MKIAGAELHNGPVFLAGGRQRPGCRLVFATLDHPATRDELRRGEAIFSLAGQGRVRVARVPKLPHPVTWTTRKGDPQGGMVWQAEELEVNGRWQRYYGFVGRYDLAKVPAEEIEFQYEWGNSEADTIAFYREDEWVDLEEQFHVGLNAAPGTREGDYVLKGEDSNNCPLLIYRVGQPMVFTLRACNRYGTDHPWPPLAEGVGGKVAAGGIPMAAAAGLSPGRHAVVSGARSPLYDVTGLAWTEVPRKTNKPLAVDPAGRVVAPTEYADCLQLDLNRLYDMSRSGTYRLTFVVPGGNKGARRHNDLVFAVTDKPASPVP